MDYLIVIAVAGLFIISIKKIIKDRLLTRCSFCNDKCCEYCIKCKTCCREEGKNESERTGNRS